MTTLGRDKGPEYQVKHLNFSLCSREDHMDMYYNVHMDFDQKSVTVRGILKNDQCDCQCGRGFLGKIIHNDSTDKKRVETYRATQHVLVTVLSILSKFSNLILTTNIWGKAL